MRRAALAACLLAACCAPAGAGAAGCYSKLDLPLYPGQRPAFRHPREFGRLYIGSPRSYAAEPREVVAAGKALTLGAAAAGFAGARDPYTAAGFFLIGLINAGDLGAALKDRSRPASDWSFLWSRDKR